MALVEVKQYHVFHIRGHQVRLPQELDKFLSIVSKQCGAYVSRFWWSNTVFRFDCFPTKDLLPCIPWSWSLVVHAVNQTWLLTAELMLYLCHQPQSEWHAYWLYLWLFGSWVHRLNCCHSYFRCGLAWIPLSNLFLQEIKFFFHFY